MRVGKESSGVLAMESFAGEWGRRGVSWVDKGSAAARLVVGSPQ